MSEKYRLIYADVEKTEKITTDIIPRYKEGFLVYCQLSEEILP